MKNYWLFGHMPCINSWKFVLHAFIVYIEKFSIFREEKEEEAYMCSQPPEHDVRERRRGSALLSPAAS